MAPPLQVKLAKANQKVREAHSRLRTTRDNWPLTSADWTYFTKAARDLNSALDEREKVLDQLQREGYA